MLTRLKVKGFKNLVDVDVRLGPFTCIAGPNAVGKSNLFDAIRFLSATANTTLMKAALAVRNEHSSRADVRSIFHRVGNTVRPEMFFEAEMIVPAQALDDLGMTATATARFLRYTLNLRFCEGSEAAANPRGPIEIVKEELVLIPLKSADEAIAFDRDVAQWRDSVLRVAAPKNRKASFISTEMEGPNRIVKLHGDGGSRGRPVTSNAATQSRTFLSIVNTAENPTVLCAKHEMASWRMLQLEPAALREPDPINAPIHMEATGAHLPATLYHLAQAPVVDAAATAQPAPEGVAALAHTDPAAAANTASKALDPGRIYCQVANRLHDLIDDVKAVNVDRNEKWDSLTLEVTGRDGTVYPARALSDGTLRFLALAVLELDPHAQGVICLEEPENGIHPERIPAILELLRDIATDPHEPVDDTNPLRQIIINTHSPAVVAVVPDDSLLVAESSPGMEAGIRSDGVCFAHQPGTWRYKADPAARTTSIGKLLSYLNPTPPREDELTDFYARVGRRVATPHRRGETRVADRVDLQPYLLHVAE